MPVPDRPIPLPEAEGDAPIIVVPDVRDYTRINSELTALLDAGHRRVRLVGVDGQRLLVSGLRGEWSAKVMIEGNAGPELASNLDAPNLTVVCHGDTKDGTGSGFRNGRLLVTGNVDIGVGYAQRGGIIIVLGSVGSRAGLDQSGGTLVVTGSAGRLAGERQSGGLMLVPFGPLGPFSGHGRSGGRLVLPSEMGNDEWILYRDALASVDGMLAS